MKKDLHAGFTVKHMPIPQRYEGNGLSLSVPQFNIPKEIKDYRALKQFIAEKFGVTPNMVIKLGESYFTHVGITPHRIHPFAIAAPPDAFKDPNTRFMPMYQYMILWRSLSKEQHFMTTIARAYMKMPEHIKLEAKRNVKAIVKTIFQAAQPDWSLPISIEQSHEEIMSAKKAKEEDKAELEANIKDKKSKKKKKGSKKTNHKKPKTKNTADDAADNEDTNDQTIDLINDFRGELEELRKVLEDDRNDSKPEPEEW